MNYPQQPGGYPPQGGYHPGYQQPMAPPPHWKQPPPQKSSNTCLIVFLVFLGLFVVGGLVVAIVVYQAVKDSPLGTAMEMFTEGTSAPGTDAMREEGCDHMAFVMDMEKFEQLAREMNEMNDGKGEDLDIPDDAPSKMVLCHVRKEKKAPTCKEIVDAYIDEAGKPDGDIGVAVQALDSNQPVCSKLYDRSGEEKGELDSTEIDVAPPPNFNEP